MAPRILIFFNCHECQLFIEGVLCWNVKSILTEVLHNGTLKLSMKDNSSLFINLQFHYIILEHSCFDKKNRVRSIKTLHHNVGNQNYFGAQFSKVKINSSNWSFFFMPSENKNSEWLLTLWFNILKIIES